MNYSQFTLDKLLERVRVIDDMMPDLTQLGLEKAQDELSAIEAELTERQPEGEFITLLDGDGQPVGFEPKIDSFAIRPSDIEPFVYDWQQASFIDWTTKRIQKGR